MIEREHNRPDSEMVLGREQVRDLLTYIHEQGLDL
jgi:hypothetical protein